VLWYVLFGAFGAFGLLCALWTVFGYLLFPMGRGSALVIQCGAGDSAKVEEALRYFSWLRGMGLYKGRLLVLDAGMTKEERAALESRKDFALIQVHTLCPEVEREDFDGT
jgi:hypothetical protein